jgi:hypothetical protein
LKFKEGFEMKTATLTEKMNRWLHEHLAMKTPAKLLGGLALGALVLTATALPLGTTYADEPARPLSSEQPQCYPEDNAVCLYGLLAEVLPDPAFTTGTSISGVQFEEWPEVGFDSYTYHRFMVDQGKVGSRLSIEDLERLAALDEAQETQLDELSRNFVGRVQQPTAEEIESQAELNRLLALEQAFYDAQEMVYDELWKSFMGVPADLSSETTRAFPDTPYYRDPDWRESQMAEESVSDQAFQAPAYLGLDADDPEEMAYDELWKNLMGRVRQPTAEEIGSQHELDRLLALEQAFQVEELESPVIGVPAYMSSEQTPCYYEIDAGCPRDSFLADVPSDPALTAGSPVAIEQGACYPLYPELGPCHSEFIAVAPAIVDRYDRGLFDEVPVHSEVAGGLAGMPLSSEQFEEWPEAGFDSYTYHRFMSEQGKVGRIDSGEQTEVFAPGDDLSYFLDQAKVGRVASGDNTEVFMPGDDLSYFTPIDLSKVGGESEIFEETVLLGRYREAPVSAVVEDTGIIEETVLPGR